MSYLLALIEQYGLAAEVVNVFVEQLGAPIPAYPSLIATGALLGRGEYTAPALLAAGVGAALAADFLWYLAGKRYGRKVMANLCRISLSPDSCVRQTDSIYNRWGSASLLVAKFIPGFASISSALAGTLGTAPVEFVLFDAIGAALWVGSAVCVGSLFRTTIDDLLNVLDGMGKWSLLAIVVALAIFIANKWLQRQRLLRSLRMARVTVNELFELQQTGTPVTVVDVRSPHAHMDGRIPGAMTMTPDELKQPDVEAKFAGDVIVYCACPNDVSAVLVAKQLMHLGFARVRPLHGGIDAWIAAGYAVEKSLCGTG